MIDLTGKHIFIAGGSRGIGAAAARLAGQAGADVSVNYVRDAEAAQAVVKDIQEMGRRAVRLQADISQEDAAELAVDEAVSQLGPLYGLVVSAGIFEGHPVEQMTMEFWDQMMAVN